MKETWWETCDVYEVAGIITTVIFEVRCKACGARFVTQTLQGMPDRCPSCRAETKEVER